MSRGFAARTAASVQERLTKGDLKDEVKTLGFGDHVDRLALGPIAEQQERLSARYRARLGSVDIDPETGKEQPLAPAAGDDPQA